MDAVEVLVQIVGIIALVIGARLLVAAIRAIILLGLTILAVLPLSTRAADCRQFFSYTPAYVAPVVYPQVYYAVGRDIEAEALAAKVAKLVTAQLRAELKQTTTAQVANASSALAVHCAKCHSGAAPKSGITIDGVTPMNCEQILDSIAAVAEDRMPKGLHQKLNPQQKGQLLDELLRLRSASSAEEVIP